MACGGFQTWLTTLRSAGATIQGWMVMTVLCRHAMYAKKKNQISDLTRTKQTCTNPRAGTCKRCRHMPSFLGKTHLPRNKSAQPKKKKKKKKKNRTGRRNGSRGHGRGEGGDRCRPRNRSAGRANTSNVLQHNDVFRVLRAELGCDFSSKSNSSPQNPPARPTDQPPWRRFWAFPRNSGAIMDHLWW